jgi:peptidoglycan/xylan/chitin deacetylase (PgdA/CDA1 family)
MYKKMAKQIVFQALNPIFGSSKYFRNYASILMYHSVDTNGVFFTVKPDDFRWQMNYLVEKDFNVVFVDELLKDISNRRPIKPKTIALTFDDGYEDFYTTAFPTLQECSLKSTVFLITGYMGKELNNSYNIPLKLLNEGQVRKLHGTGLVHFEPHTEHHPNLIDLSREHARIEIVRSRMAIESILGESCHLFAYPKGLYNEEIKNIVEECGLEGAFTVKEGLARKNSDLFELRRNSIDSSVTKAQFIGKLGYSVEVFNKIFRK